MTKAIRITLLFVIGWTGEIAEWGCKFLWVMAGMIVWARLFAEDWVNKEFADSPE